MASYCCACTAEIGKKLGSEYIAIMYSAPDETATPFIAVICTDCSAYAQHSDANFIAIEAIINARIARLKNPDKSYYPPQDDNTGRRDDGA